MKTAIRFAATLMAASVLYASETDWQALAEDAITKSQELLAQDAELVDAARRSLDTASKLAEELKALGLALPDEDRLREARADALNTVIPGTSRDELLQLLEQQPMEVNDALNYQAGDMVFVSTSLARETLLDILRYGQVASDQPRFLLAGLIDEDGSINDTMVWMRQLVSELPSDLPEPLIMLFPQAYIEHDIQQVPVRVRHGDDDVIWIQPGGVRRDSIDDAIQQHLATNAITSGQVIVLPSLANTTDIAETNLLITIAKRIETVDWDEQIDGSKRRMWHNMAQWNFPDAIETVEVLHEAWYESQETIEHPLTGEVFVQKGQLFNALDGEPPYPKSFVIFDANRTSHLALLPKMLNHIREQRPDHEIEFLLLDLDRNNGMEHFEYLQSSLPYPVFWYVEPLQNIFRLTHAPATAWIDTNNRWYRVQYFDIGDP